jgi:4-aminobutyrate aminotransferase-like enzyme
MNKWIKGKESKKIMEKTLRYESPGHLHFALYEFPIPIERAEGSRIYDADGNEYIDLLSGFAVSALGHAHAQVVEAINNQAKNIFQFCEMPNSNRAELAEKIVHMTPGNFKKKIFYTVTGGEAIEVAMKLARWYTDKPILLNPYNSYHGRTQGAQSLTSKAFMYSYQNAVLPPAGVEKFHYPYCYRCPYDKEYPGCDFYCVDQIRVKLESSETHLRDPKKDICNAAGIFMETCQASAGYITPPKGYLKRIRDLCDEYGMLLILDEIQCGMGRTGKMWACEHEDVAPDIMTIAKAISGGMPLSITVAREEIMDSTGPGFHCTTFGGYMLGCATALAVLETYEKENVLENVNKMGQYFIDRLGELKDKYPLIGDVNGWGLFIGIELVKDRKTKEPAAKQTAKFQEICFTEGILQQASGPFGNRINLIPQLTVDKQTIDRVINIYDKALSNVSKNI